MGYHDFYKIFRLVKNPQKDKLLEKPVSYMGTQTNDQNQKTVHTPFGMIYLKTQHPVYFP